MMKTWTKILPFFFIEWYAKRHMQRYDIPAKDSKTVRFIRPYENVSIRIGELELDHTTRKKYSGVNKRKGEDNE